MLLMCIGMKLSDFLKFANKAERLELATVCNNSIAYLYQIAGQHRFASPQMATRIERVSHKVADQSRGRLKPVPRESLVRHPEIFIGLLDRD